MDAWRRKNRPSAPPGALIRTSGAAAPTGRLSLKACPEEVITGLSRFSYLRVIAGGSTAKYSSESGEVRATSKELGPRYVMEDSPRQAGNKLRVAVQLVEASTGSHLWAETFERTFNPETVFELQDDLVPGFPAEFSLQGVR
jgi:TolB-like protein